jgi:sucrose phosphorylase
MGAKEVLSKKQIDFVIATAIRHGAYVSYKVTATQSSEPYEINSTWWSAINNEESKEDVSLQVQRYVASRSLALSLRGVPGIYIHGSLGSSNDRESVTASGIYRDVNRGHIDANAIFDELEQSGSKLARIRGSSKNAELIRTRERAFHPNGTQRILMLSPRVFAVSRSSPENDRHVLALINVTSLSIQVTIPLDLLPISDPYWEDLLSRRIWFSDNNRLAIEMEPYEILWLKPRGQSMPVL